MKLSELSTDRALDVLCELTPYADNIFDDDDIVNVAGERFKSVENINLYGQLVMLAGRASKMTPILLKTHRTDVYGILSILNEKTVEEIAAQPVSDTIRQAKEALQDNELVLFFKSYMQRALKGRSEPSADSPGSE